MDFNSLNKILEELNNKYGEKIRFSIDKSSMSECVFNNFRSTEIFIDVYDNNDNFLLHLKAIENDGVLMELKVTVPTKKQAILLCSKWKDNPSDIYNNIINMLFSEDS